jgi:enterochelin esterase-like enzyme
MLGAMSALPAREGPHVGDDTVTFFLADPEARYTAVGLMQDVWRPRDWTPFEQVDGGWQLVAARPDVDRLEYQLKVVHADGGDETLCDPANPLRAPGAFGEKSVLEMPGYSPPAWLDGPAPAKGRVLKTTIPSRTIRADVHMTLWSSRDADPEEPLPLLVAHDGSEYAQLSSLLILLEGATCDGRLPPMRAALLDPPGDRDEMYSASGRYTRAMATEIMPALEWLAPTPDRRRRVGMGASLGALAMLHVHRERPGTFGGLFLQSGSYFRQRFDKHEAGFPRFRRISRFVGEVLAGPGVAPAIPVTLTCGTVEENLANNRAVTAALKACGYDARLVVNRDAHNYVAWRDVFDPHLVDLLDRCWSDAGNGV